MADHSHIEWTDATWSPITGCSVVSPGCTNCYAMRLAGSRLRAHPSRIGLTTPSKAGPVWNGAVRLNAAWLDQPLTWPKRVRRIFVCAHGDLFHEAVPDAWIDNVFARMALAPSREFQVLTKRAERMADYLADHAMDRRVGAIMDEVADDDTVGWFAPESDGKVGWLSMASPLPNVLIGVSVEDQVRANERRSHLERVAALGWPTLVSYEPALGGVDWAGWQFLRWLIAGGESGTGARPMHPDWARAARDWCAAHGVPFLFKQWGAWLADAEPSVRASVGGGRGEVAWPDGKIGHGHFTERGGFGRKLIRMTKTAAGRSLDGVTHDGFPALGAAR